MKITPEYAENIIVAIVQNKNYSGTLEIKKFGIWIMLKE